MGICSSCLGGGRRKPHEACFISAPLDSFGLLTGSLRGHQDPETSRLLSDDPYRSNYGSRTPNIRRTAEEADAELDRQRERAALESIAHGMSE